MLRIVAWIFTAGVTAVAVVAAGAAFFLWQVSRDLPDHSALREYHPPVMTRVHAVDGSLIGEHARQRRIHLPIDAVPEQIIEAFLAAEDRNFFEHSGIDFMAIGRAIIDNVEHLRSGRRPVGASTITQQVAKNMLLTDEVTLDRKLQEALLALRIENALTKEQILEIYLNEIYFGLGAYGIAAAALAYFDKAVDELELHEVAYLAALPKAPNHYHPVDRAEQATARRNWVINRMWTNGFISQDEAEAARAAELSITPHRRGILAPEAAYFAEDVRRQLVSEYGARKVYEGGMSVRTTLDPTLQRMARKALVDGLVSFDRGQGWRGPIDTVDLSGPWQAALGEIRQLRDVAPWRLAVVLEVDDVRAEIGLRPTGLGVSSAGEPETGEIRLEGLRWARWADGPRRGRQISSPRQVLEPGDVIYVSPLSEEGNAYELQQVPEIGGALVAMEPTGRVVALVGGFSYDESEFNRATQAMRQPGSAIKPFIYAAALDNGFLPNSIIDDSPIEIMTDEGVWRPQNYSREFYGPTTLRRGLENSRNVMTVRLADELGMPLVNEYLRRFGIDEDIGAYLSIALGAGETTPLKLTAAYAMIANGGRKVTPTLIDRIQDRHGKTIYRHDPRDCARCDPGSWAEQPEPELIDSSERVLDPYTAYQITSMLEGVVQRGTGTVVREVGRTLAGKTGTTNDFRDAWFVGFSRDLVVGVFVGYDRPRSLGQGMAGGRLAAPIFRDFMKVALEDKPDRPFEPPSEMKLVEVDAATGQRAHAGGPVILEAFKPGQEPQETLPTVRYADDGRQGPAMRPYGHRRVPAARGPAFMERLFQGPSRGTQRPSRAQAYHGSSQPSAASRGPSARMSGHDPMRGGGSHRP